MFDLVFYVILVVLWVATVFFVQWLCRWNTKEGTPSTSNNTPMLANAQICQNIVEDQLNYLIRIGLDFKEGEKNTVRDNLYRIVAGKLQHV